MATQTIESVPAPLDEEQAPEQVRRLPQWRVKPGPGLEHRLRIARAAGLWTALAWVFLTLLVLPGTRPAVAAFVPVFALVVLAFTLMLTRTVRWTTVAWTFALGLTWSAAAATGVRLLLTDPESALTQALGAGPIQSTVPLIPLAAVALAQPRRVRTFAVSDWLLLGLTSGLAFDATLLLTRALTLTPGDARLGFVSTTLVAGLAGLAVVGWRAAARAGTLKAVLLRGTWLVAPLLAWWLSASIPMVDVPEDAVASLPEPLRLGAQLANALPLPAIVLTAAVLVLLTALLVDARRLLTTDEQRRDLSLLPAPWSAAYWVKAWSWRVVRQPVRRPTSAEPADDAEPTDSLTPETTTPSPIYPLTSPDSATGPRPRSASSPAPTRPTAGHPTPATTSSVPTSPASPIPTSPTPSTAAQPSATFAPQSAPLAHPTPSDPASSPFFAHSPHPAADEPPSPHTARTDHASPVETSTATTVQAVTASPATTSAQAVTASSTTSAQAVTASPATTAQAVTASPATTAQAVTASPATTAPTPAAPAAPAAPTASAATQTSSIAAKEAGERGRHRASAGGSRTARAKTVAREGFAVVLWMTERLWRTLVISVCALVAYAARDKIVILAAHAGVNGESRLTQLVRGRAAMEMTRHARQEAYTARSGPAGRREVVVWRTAAVVSLILMAGALWLSYTALQAQGVATDSFWLSGYLAELAPSWLALTVWQQVVLVGGAGSLVALSGGSLGMAFGVSGAANYLASHGHGAGTFVRDPRAAAGMYARTVTPGALLADGAELVLTLVPVSFAGAVQGRQIRVRAEDYLYAFDLGGVSDHLAKAELFSEFATRAVPAHGYQDFVIQADRGSAATGFSPKAVAKLILKDAAYSGGPVRLIPGAAGGTPPEAAQALADKLGVQVLAPSDTVHVFDSGTLVLGPSPLVPTGEWLTFRPGAQP